MVFTQRKAKQLFLEGKKHQFDALIVPGVPLKNGRWNKVMKGRVYWAKYLFDQGIVENIIFSGKSTHGQHYEGKVMAMYGQAIGLPSENIYSEIEAEHSTENITFSARLAKKHGFTKLAAASDHVQLGFLRRYIKKYHPNMHLFPFVISTLKQLESEMIDPEIDFSKAVNPNYVDLKKRENKLKRFKGTLGKNIKH